MPTMSFRHRRRIGVILGIAASVAPLAVIAPANAAPIDQKRAEASRLQAQIEAQGERISVLDEQYNQAMLRAQKADAAAAQTKADLAKSDQRFAAARARMAAQAVNAYIHGGQVSVLASLARSDGHDLAIRTQYLSAASAREHQTADELRQAGQDLQVLQARLAASQKASKNAVAAANSSRRQAQAAESQLQSTLGKVKGELGALVAAEEARRAADAARRAQAARSRAVAVGSRPTRNAPPPGSAPATSTGAAAAVRFAEAQVGKPYSYGASGPDAYDCSGLTMRSWQQGGVGLSHSSQAQWSETTHISTADLQPGDILFYGSDIHHVGIYVGNGTMVEASHSGVPVRYASIWRGDLVGAGRPG
jgi:cell wall-associated NlpC family hydrolase